jgi:hexaprenyl-diphosphate synthase
VDRLVPASTYPTMICRSAAPALRAISRASTGSSSRLPLPRSRLRPLHTSPISRSPNSSSRNDSAWAAATETAHSVLTPPTLAASQLDPLAAIHSEISTLKDSLFRLLGSSHPSLDTIAKYYFHAEGKHLRPLIVLLMSQATNGMAGAGWTRAREEALAQSVDDSLTAEGGVLNDWNPELSGPEPTGASIFGEPFRIPNLTPNPPQRFPPLAPIEPDDGSPQILPTQRRLASITEMIHVASLLHDDVIDASSLRRGQPSAPAEFGNKLSILSGDFLLGRASVALARLGSREVVELLATVIANLVEGEVMQLRATSEPERTPTRKGFEEYMRKTYLKTASLMAKSARAAVILGGSGRGEAEWVKEVAYGYGRNLGIAFQVSLYLLTWDIADN